MIIPYQDHSPDLGKDVFIAPNAWVIGNVALADRCSVFFGAILRGDLEAIKVGSESNIQEHALLHTSSKRQEVRIGQGCTIGHRAIVHSATVGDHCLVGMGATLLDDSVLEDECVIGAGALVTENKRIPRGSLVMGVPGKVVRTLSDEELSFLRQSASEYVDTAANYLAMDLDPLG